MSSWLAGKGIQVFYAKERVFILDSTRTSSLTLRDYSKVVAGHKLSFSRKNKLPLKDGEDAWRFHAVTASPLDRRLSCRRDLHFWFPYCSPHKAPADASLAASPTLRGAVLGGVKVTAVNEATGVARDTQTSDSGDYVFPDLPVGTYTLNFELAGFKKGIHKGIALDVNQVITLNMTMQIGGAQEVVDVTSEAPLVDTTSTQLGAVVNNRSVNELPLNARDTYQFLQLQPGVQSQLGSSGGTFYGSDDAGAVSVNGGRGRANNFSVNGGDANDQFVQPANDPAHP
jgi:hypothetical protein